MSSSVLLFSGGLDSFIYWRLLGQPPALYVPLNHKYQALERASIARLEEYVRASAFSAHISCAN